MDNDQDFSIKALDDFLVEAAKRGTMKFHTARTRRTALVRISAYLTENEREDVRRVVRNELADRIRSAEPTISEGTIQTYLTRLERTLDEYVSTPLVADHEQLVQPVVQERRDTLVVPLRGSMVRIANVPRDLTIEEAEQIYLALKAYVETENA